MITIEKDEANQLKWLGVLYRRRRRRLLDLKTKDVYIGKVKLEYLEWGQEGEELPTGNQSM